MPPLVEMKDVYKIYHMGDTEVHALDGISLTINKGEFVAIVGQSGSGKSTCMNIIGCLDVATKGVYRLNGREINNYSQDELADVRNKMLGFIFQQYNLLPKLTVLENVELPLLYRGLKRADRQRLAAAALERVGLLEWAHHTPAELSGGQQQRVAIARAIVIKPKLLLADEPTGSLDSSRSIEIMKLLRDLNEEEDITIALVTHEPDMAAFARRHILFKDGKLVDDDHGAKLDFKGESM